jgi:penicillin amidase
MKTVKKFSCNVITMILIVGGVLYGFYLKPKYEGEVQLKSIQDQTTVYFDDFEFLIYANNSIDAMTALGYVHAQDRLWQMELMRRIAPGRLSEIFGKVALKNDTFFAGLGIEEASEQAIADLDKNSESYKLTMGYLDGINQYMEEGCP